MSGGTQPVRPPRPQPSWGLDRFEALTPARLEALFAVRQRVFIVEQNCLFADIDGRDAQAWHLVAWPEGFDPAAALEQRLPWACARLLGPGAAFDRPSIGRVLTHGIGRGSGLANPLMRRAVEACERLWPGQGQALGAQAHLTGWYARHGFVPTGTPYDEDGILHQDMQRAAGGWR